MLQVVGHRGAGGIRPENTLASFNHAIELGVHLVECDVRLTRDRRLVVIHDKNVDRTTNGTGAVADLTFDEIRALDAGAGERVPTFDEVLDTVQGRAGLLCELKGEDTEEQAAQAVDARNMASHVIFTCFHLERLVRIKELGSHHQIGALFADPSTEDIARAIDLGVDAMGICYKNLCLRMVEQVREAGIPLRAWNPDTRREQEAMIALGVDSISSNRPDILLDTAKSL